MPFGIAPMGIAALSAYRGDLVLARGALRANIPMIMSGSSLIRARGSRAGKIPTRGSRPTCPGEERRFTPLDRARGGRRLRHARGHRGLRGAVQSREQHARGLLDAAAPHAAPRVGRHHPSALALRQRSLRTLVRHGMPHFENYYAERGAPILARNVERDFGQRDHLHWEPLRARSAGAVERQAGGQGHRARRRRAHRPRQRRGRR